VLALAAAIAPAVALGPAAVLAIVDAGPDPALSG
jgi:hypothetical protein